MKTVVKRDTLLVCPNCKWKRSPDRAEYEQTVFQFRPAEAAATAERCSLEEYLGKELVEIVTE